VICPAVRRKYLSLKPAASSDPAFGADLGYAAFPRFYRDLGVDIPGAMSGAPASGSDRRYKFLGNTDIGVSRAPVRVALSATSP